MTGDRLNADAEQYLQAAGLNVPPPIITSDPLVSGNVPIEQLLRILGIAANAGDPTDNADSLEQHASRDAKITEAAAKFPAQDENASAEMRAVAAPGDAQSTAQLTQQLPQLASGLAGALAGALGGVLQPFAQLPQQLAQGAQQALQTGMGMMQQANGTAGQLGVEDFADIPLEDEFDSGAAYLDGNTGAGTGSGGVGGGGIEGTAPTSMLGPAPIPSAGTYPSSAPLGVTPAPGAVTSAPPGTSGMSGMPFVPPAAMRGAGDAEKDAKTDVKRLSVPPVKNGAAVQGRITTPPPPPMVTKKFEGMPVATKRIVTREGAPAGEPK